MTLVSVIIPVYNCGESLHRTMQSVLAQSYPDIEVILVDDGSTDDSFSVVKEYENEQVKVILQINSGAAVARNTGLAQAKGDYIQFLDAGDLLSADKIAKQVQQLNCSQTKVAVCNYLQFSNTEQPLASMRCPDQSSFIYSTNDPLDFLVNLWGGKGESNFIQTNSWLVPKALIEKAGGWRAYRCPDDDGEFFARIVLASEGIVYIPGVLNYYHVSLSETRLSRSRVRKYLQNTLLTIDLKHRYLKAKGTHAFINKAMAVQYLRFAADQYPTQKILSAIAYKRYLELGEEVPLPVLGGKTIEMVKKLVGWRAARLLRYFTRER